MNQIAFGIDLAGYSTGKSGLAKAQRDDAGNIAVTIFRGHPFSRQSNGFARVDDVVVKEVGILVQLLSKGKVLIDMPLDLQSLSTPNCATQIWQLTKRPVDYVFSALPPLADKIGSPVARAQIILATLKERSPEQIRFGDNLYETYPAGSLELIELPRKGYKDQSITFVEGKWRGESLATIANGLRLQAGSEISLNDDDVDAIICALTGVVDSSDVLETDLLEKEIADRLKQSLPPSVEIVDPMPPKGYRLLRSMKSIKEITVTECNWEDQ